MKIARQGCLTLTLFFLSFIPFTSSAQAIEPGSTTVLPTDVEPLPGRSTAATTRSFTHALQMRLWQRMPASMFFAGSVETSMRIETNPYQYPMKRTFLKQNLPPGTDFLSLLPEEQFTISSDLAQIGALDNVHRITPNGTAGWSLTPNTQLFANAFFLRDSLCHNYPLNSNTGAVGIGAQHNISVTDKLSIQPQYIVRELWQSQQVPVLDHLPSITLQYNPNPNVSLFANALLQVRFAHFIGSYMRELDPFYTWGGVYQRNNWTFSASSTFLQNFRSPFSKALTPINNYSFVCDFEIDRPIIQKLPGLVAFVRAEPVYNFHSKATPGLAGMDFRLYYGVRLTAVKPALNDTIQQIRQRYLYQPGAQPGTIPGAPSGNSSSNNVLDIRRAIALDCVSDQSEDPTVCLTMHGKLPANAVE